MRQRVSGEPPNLIYDVVPRRAEIDRLITLSEPEMSLRQFALSEITKVTPVYPAIDASLAELAIWRA